MSASFRKPWVGELLSRDERARQSEAVKAATNALGGNAARAFLNAYHLGLRARPLDLAIASAAGLVATEEALRVVQRGFEASLPVSGDKEDGDDG
jgi:hypothetical protein